MESGMKAILTTSSQEQHASAVSQQSLKASSTLELVEVDEHLLSHGPYWRPNAWMIACYVGAVAAGLGHHLYYSQYNGKLVSSTSEQATNLRVGNFFALAVKLLLSVPVWYSYTQWLWRKLKRTSFSLRSLDIAFSAESNPLVVLTPELWKLDLGIALILIGWTLQIPQLFTPATLTVVQTDLANPVMAEVPSLNIGNSTQSNLYAYSRPANWSYPSASPDSYILAGPRTVLTRLISATASFGQILSIQPPSARSSYELNVTAPYISCNPANAMTGNIIEALVQNRNTSLLNSSSEEILSYYAFIPAFNASYEGNNSIVLNGTQVTALDRPRLHEGIVNASNELWIKFWRYQTNADGTYTLDARGSKIAQPQYWTCGLWNATYTAGFSFDNGFQSIQNVSIDLLNRVEYPIIDPSAPSNLIQHAYTAYFSVFTDQLVGTMGLLITKGANLSTMSKINVIDSSIEQSSLLGSNDLDFVFDLGRESQGVDSSNISMPHNLSNQRLRDKALAQNQTLPFLIEQLAFNATISLMDDPSLAPSSLVEITQTSLVNTYTYNAKNLWLAYGIAYACVFIATIVGFLAMRDNHASHNNSMSTILSISRDPRLSPLFPECSHGRLPLPRETMDMRVQIQGMEGGGRSLVPVGSAQPVCKACADAHGRSRSVSRSAT